MYILPYEETFMRHDPADLAYLDLCLSEAVARIRASQAAQTGGES
ncbi:hypothetical protein [Microtetraspora niveoalba]|nr:hypothetical protein [Microtetraspora niveoalba]